MVKETWALAGISTTVATCSLSKSERNFSFLSSNGKIIHSQWSSDKAMPWSSGSPVCYSTVPLDSSALSTFSFRNLRVRFLHLISFVGIFRVIYHTPKETTPPDSFRSGTDSMWSAGFVESTDSSIVRQMTFRINVYVVASLGIALRALGKFGIQIHVVHDQAYKMH